MSASLPIEIERFLRRCVRRSRGLALLQAVGTSLFLVMAWTFAAMLLDRILRLPPHVRAGLLSAGVLFLVVPVLRAIRGLIRRRIDYLDGAAEIERAHRGFGQKLLTVVSQLHERAEYRGSPQMVQWLVDDVSREAAQATSPPLPWRAALRPWAGAAALGLIFALAGLLPWFGQARLLQRLAAPYSGVPPVSTTQITLEPGHVRVLYGQPLTIRARAKSLGGGSLDVLTSTDGSAWSRLPMVAVSDSEFQFNLPSVEQAFRYYIAGGDARTEVFQVHVLRAPAIAELSLTLHYPPYAGREPWSQNSGDGVVEALGGTRMQLRLTASEDLASASLVIGGKELPLKTTRLPRVFETELLIEQSQTAELVMNGADGLFARIPRALTIRLQPDRAPLARIIAPAGDLQLAPRGVLEIESQFMDDYGVAAASLQVQVNSLPPRTINVPSGPEPRRIESSILLDLAELHVNVGDIIVVSAGAEDGAAQRASRDTRTIIIATRSVDAERLQCVSELRRAMQLAGEVKRDLDRSAALANRDGAADSLAEVLQAKRAIGAASDNALLAHQALLRAVVHSPSPPVTNVLASLVDEMRNAAALTERIAALDADNAPRRIIADSLRDLATKFAAASSRLKVLADAELSQVILAQRQNLKAIPSERSSDKRWRDAIKRLQQEINAAVQELNLQSSGAALDERLQRRIDAGAQLCRDAARPALASTARLWAAQATEANPLPPPLAQRLFSAAAVAALRPDPDPVLARDYQLAARVAEQISPPAASQPDGALSQSLSRLAALLKVLEEDAAQHEGEASSPEAEDARAQLAQWAQARDSLDDLAVGASAAMARRDYTQAAQLDARQAAASPEAARVAADLGRRLDQARAVDLSRQEQSTAAGQTRRGVGSAAEDQRSVAGRIASLVVRALGRDARRDSVALLEQAQRELAAYPQRLTETLRLAAAHRDQQALLTAARQALDQSTPERRAGAQRTLAAAEAAVKDSRESLDAALARLNPARIESLAGELGRFEPQTSPARGILTTRLQPALRSLAGELRESRGEPAAKSIREALEAAQLALQAARQSMLEQDPHLAAQWYAEAAADALEADPPEISTARQYQDNTLRWLDRAWQDNLRSATLLRLESAPGFRAILRSDAPDSGRFARLSSLTPAAREWRILSQRGLDTFSAPRESDAPTFQEPLKLYFDALSKAQDQASKK